jgi:hypothetical protein
MRVMGKAKHHRTGGAVASYARAARCVTIAQPDYGSVLLTFGLHDGQTLSEVFEVDRGYVYWLGWKANPETVIVKRFRSYARAFLKERRAS